MQMQRPSMPVEMLQYQMEQMDQMPHPSMMQQLPHIPIENNQDIMYMKNQMYPPASSPQIVVGDVGIKQILTRFADDLKLGAVIFAAIFAVHYIPLEGFIGKYFAIEKIPYHETILRAAAAAIIIILVKNLVLTQI
jgi:hypothetical protein